MLKGLEPVKQRPGMYTRTDNPLHILQEVIDNAADEALAGFGKKIKLTIDNQDATPEEFESHELNREKVIPGKSKLSIFIGPLKPGKYPYIGEFNKKTANGVIVAE